jgi:WD40 repeat protein
MPRPNYGPEVKKRAKRLFEGLLRYIGHELEGSDPLQIQTHWQSENRLIVRTKLRYLEALTALDAHYGKLTGSEIKEAFTRLKDLDLLEDNRVATQGSDSWHFTLSLWHRSHEVTANLRRLDEEWDQRKQQRTSRERLTVPTVADDPDRPIDSAPNLQQQDWGAALSIATIYGRTQELATLQQWVVAEQCRLVALIGMGGVGKTTLSVQFAEQVQGQFDRLVWRSLQNAPPLQTLLLDLVSFISGQPNLPRLETAEAQIAELLKYLRQSRCLILLDNVESILQAGSQAGAYLPGYEAYGLLFKAIGETTHQSCLLLTSREKPSQVAWLEGDGSWVRSLPMQGLTPAEGQAIFTAKGCFGATETEWQEIFNYFAGNPLALKIVASALQEATGGDATELLPFLRESRFKFQGIHDLLAQQFERLSSIEQQVLYWLAINREPISLAELADDLVSESGKQQLPEAIQSLSRRCLVERNGRQLSLQPVVMEYITDCLITGGLEELINQHYSLLRNHALIKAQSKDYVRQIQVRLILNPMVDGLLTHFDTVPPLIQHLKGAIEHLRQTAPQQPSYAGGNLLNLLIQLKADLSDLDFSNLAIWQAHLVNINLHGVNFTGADLTKSVFTDTLGITLAVAFSPDGSQLATTGANGVISLWCVAKGKKILTCKGHGNWVWSVRFSPDGKTYASASSDQTLKLWDTETGNCLRTFAGHQGWVVSVRYSPDGKYLASGSSDRQIKLWDVTTGNCLQTFQGHVEGVIAIAFSPDGTLLASASEDRTIKLWSLATGKCLTTFSGHEGSVFAVVFSADGQRLASGGGDRAIKLWNIQTGECIQTLLGHTNNVLTLAFSPEDKWLLSSGRDGTIKFWDVTLGHCVRTIQAHTARVFTIALSPDGYRLASGSDDKTVRLWDVTSGTCLRMLQGYNGGVLSLCFSPDGRSIASSSEDKTIRLWDVASQTCLHLLKGHKSWVFSVRFSPDGKILASGSDDQSIKLWDVDTGKCLTTLGGEGQSIFDVMFSPDGRYLASSNGDHTIQLWDTATYQLCQILKGHTNRIFTVAFSPDGKTLVSGGHDRLLKLWNSSTGECYQTLKGHTGQITAVCFSPDGKRMVSSSDDATIKFWDSYTGECLNTLLGHEKTVVSVAFSPDGRYVASGSNDTTVRLWDGQTGESVGQIQAHPSGVYAVAFHPDGQLLASSGQSGNIKLWTVPELERVATLRGLRPYENMNITGAIGLTEAEQETLKILGGVVR